MLRPPRLDPQATCAQQHSTHTRTPSKKQLHAQTTLLFQALQLPPMGSIMSAALANSLLGPALIFASVTADDVYELLFKVETEVQARKILAAAW